jgi:hypothetical protein
MATRTWNQDRASKRIAKKISALPVKDILIKEYVRDTDLGDLPRTSPTESMASMFTRTF